MADIEDDVLVCTACQFAIESATIRASHYTSEWHRYNIKRRCANLAPIGEAIFTAKLNALKAAQEENKQVKSKCELCNKSFSCRKAMENHFRSKTHKKKLNKKAKTSNQPSPALSALAPSLSALAPSLAGVLGSPVSPVEMDQAQDDEDEDEEDGEEQTRKIAGDRKVAFEGENATMEEEGEGDGEEEGEVIPVTECLFCRKVSQNMEQNLTHMLRKHSFFIPFADNLVNLLGLMEYLGAKVGVGRMCLWCNGRKRARYDNERAVQQHMVDSGHCKLRFEDEDEEEDGEFVDFYDFTPKEKPEQGEDAVTLTDINEAGELVLSNGNLIGHRDLARVYQQRAPRPEETRESVLINQLMARHKALTLAGWRDESKWSERKESNMHRQKHYWMRLGIKQNKLSSRTRMDASFQQTR